MGTFCAAKESMCLANSAVAWVKMVPIRQARSRKFGKSVSSGQILHGYDKG